MKEEVSKTSIHRKAISMTWLKKFWWGVVLPLVIFIAWLFVVALWPTGMDIEGSCAGLLLFLPQFIPWLALFNCWVFFIEWKRTSTLFLGGISLPALIGLVVCLFCHGPLTSRKAIGDAVFNSPSWIRIVVGILPLLISIIHRLLARKATSQ